MFAYSLERNPLLIRDQVLSLNLAEPQTICLVVFACPKSRGGLGLHWTRISKHTRDDPRGRTRISNNARKESASNRIGFQDNTMSHARGRAGWQAASFALFEARARD